LQSFLARGLNDQSASSSSPHFYMLDESSLASTKQMRAFLDKMYLLLAVWALVSGVATEHHQNQLLTTLLS
jgi:hypothetical protein